MPRRISLRCNPASGHHDPIDCVCPAKCQECGAPELSLCTCPRCIVCRRLVKDNEALCPECTQAEAEYWAGDDLSKRASYLSESRPQSGPGE